MAIKAPPPGDDVPAFKRPEGDAPAGPGGIGKEELLDLLIVLTVEGYNAKYVTKDRRTTQRVDVSVTIVGTGASHSDVAFFGNLALQVSEHLSPGDTGVGFVRTGTTGAGRPWWGWEASRDESDYVLAAAAVVA